MIIVKEVADGKKYVFLDRDEKQRTEEKLTGKIILRGNLILDEYESYHTILIPYVKYTGRFSHDGEIDQDDIVVGVNNTSFARAKLSSSSKKIAIHLNLDDVPQRYNYLDVFIYPNIALGSLYVKDVSLSIEKEEVAPQKLFSYIRNFNKVLYGVMIGTFGRIDNGWKFYPQFYETIMNRDKLLRMYLGNVYNY